MRDKIKIIIFLVLMLLHNYALAERIKDLASIAGIRSNQLIGYGLVVGLDGTGDSTQFTTQSFKTMLSSLGLQLPPNANADSKNIAAAVIHADLPAFAQPGQYIDVTVSSIGNAKSLRGGTLLLTDLKGLDGKVYAVAQGNLVVGGFGAEGNDGSKIKVNVPVVGRIPRGAIIERPSPSTLYNNDKITLLLHRADFTTAKRMADAINAFLGTGASEAHDAGAVIVSAPLKFSERVQFLSALENIALTPGEESAKIIVNSRTGTIVIGKYVRVGPAAVTHGSLTVTIKENNAVSQPLPGTTGQTTNVQNTELSVAQENSRMFMLDNAVSLNSIVTAINQVGAAPGDLMAILEALESAGALTAKIEVI